MVLMRVGLTLRKAAIYMNGQHKQITHKPNPWALCGKKLPDGWLLAIASIDGQ